MLAGSSSAKPVHLFESQIHLDVILIVYKDNSVKSVFR